MPDLEHAVIVRGSHQVTRGFPGALGRWGIPLALGRKKSGDVVPNTGVSLIFHSKFH